VEEEVETPHKHAKKRKKRKDSEQDGTTPIVFWTLQSTTDRQQLLNE
jgi:hypothetical protein